MTSSGQYEMNVPQVGHRRIKGSREYQEDDYRVFDDLDGGRTILILSDGMGGHVGGAKASKIAVDASVSALENSVDISVGLVNAWQSANNSIADAIEQNGSLSGMGCTLVVSVIEKNRVWWVSIGDSPHWRYRDGELTRLNKDHSMAPVLAKLVEAGELTKAEAATSSRRNALRSALIGEDVPLVDLPQEPVDLRAGDLLILSSDGLETLSVDEITQVLSKGRVGTDGQRCADALVDAVLKKGKPNQDNTTVLVYSVVPNA